MKLSFLPCFILVAVLLFLGCKDAATKEDKLSEEISDNVEDPLDAIETEQQKELANAYFYIMAPSGLSLRKSNTPTSEKIMTIPFGGKVKQLSPVFTVDFTIEHINGSMMEVDYKGQTGYAFSGFLSPYPMPIKDEEAEAYVQRLKKVRPKVSFDERRTDPDFHEGVVQTIVLPQTQWHEAFYLAKANYNIPNSLNFPGHHGEAKTIISQKDKEEYVWASNLFVSRVSNRLDTLQYNWRAEGGGYWITITQPKQGELAIEYTAFAD